MRDRLEQQLTDKAVAHIEKHVSRQIEHAFLALGYWTQVFELLRNRYDIWIGIDPSPRHKDTWVVIASDGERFEHDTFGSALEKAFELVEQHTPRQDKAS